MRQLFPSGHWSFFLQLHPFSGVVLLFLVVVVDDASHVRHAAVADFHVVLVKDGVQIFV